MFFWDIVVVVEECPCGPFCRPFTQHNCMGILELPIDDTTVALPSFVLLHTAAEALPSFLLFRDFLPIGSCMGVCSCGELSGLSKTDSEVSSKST